MSKVVATGQYLPANRLTNEQLIAQAGIDSSDEWIVQRTGVKARRFAEAESVADLATEAARAILANVGPDVKEDIRLIIVASMSSGNPTPSIANQVQANLGIAEAWGFDISGACSGFTMAVDIAERISRTYETGYVLVIGADKMSQILDLSDRTSSIIFGDGAGGLLIACDGAGLPGYCSQLVALEDTKNAITLDKTVPDRQHLTMLGRDVFNFVVRAVIPGLAKFIDELNGSYDYVLSHQANDRLLDVMSQKLGIDRQQIPANIAEVANTSSASIPILLDDLVQAGTIELSGQQQIVMVGFGGGLAYGINYFKL